MDITKVYVTTDGLYEWGRGFVKDGQSEEWHSFWESYSGIFWKAVSDSSGSVYLVSIYGGGMIRPMDFGILLNLPEDRVGSEVAELDRAMKRLSVRAGFRYNIYVTGCNVSENAPVEFGKTEKEEAAGRAS